jgi:putative glutamine amidotransferase
MPRRPVIAVSTSITVGTPVPPSPRPSPERAYVNSTYLRAVQQAGGVPVLLPPQLDPEAVEQLMAAADGLLLTGGGDIDPARFGEPAHPTCYDVAPARDEVEIRAVRRALDRTLPVLAICRGVQVLNVALGGGLYQDIASDPGSHIAHSQAEPRDRPTHPVMVKPGSRLAETLGVDEVAVNSMHHQAVRELGRGLVDVAWAPDRVIEGVELTDSSRFVLGVQWHPEELVACSEPARRLFSALVSAAGR